MEKLKEAVCREESDASSEDETNHSSASSGFKEKEDDDRPMEASAATGIKKNDAGFILALCGDAGSIVTGSKNILIPQKEHTHFSSMLYDLCGRHISVINLLGQQDIIDIEETTLNKGINAFLLLIKNGHHENHYKSGLRWLEKNFGRESLPYVMTVVTRSLGEKCEDALKDLKAHESFAENRYHVCIRSMSEAEEIAELLVKIEIMVSENNPSCFTGRIRGGNREQKEDLEPEHHGYKSMEPAVLKGNQTGQEVEMSAAKRKAPANKQRPASPVNDDDNAANKTGRSDKNLGQNIEKKVKKDDGIPQHSQHQTEIETLLNRLQLKEKFPRKMSPGDFLHIGLPLTPDHDMSEKNLAYSFLQKLIKLDHRARYIPVKQESLQVTHAKHVPDSDGNDSDENDLDYFLSSSSETSEPAQTHIHPMDVQMAVFHCSDSYLRQIMVTKLSQCQYALPFLVPDPLTMEIECPLWAFRQITKTWKETKGDSHTTTMNIQICNAKTPLVSFFRLGSLSVSKSQLMNSLINDRHSTFFHRHSPGSTKTRHLLDGVAEITWYCPNGKPNDAFNNCIAFCNLHGDAVMIEKQRQILTEMSSINVVMVNNLQKDDKSWPVISALLRSKKPLICLLVKDDCKVMESKKGKFKMGLKERNQADVSKELKRIIQELLSSDDPLILKTIFQLETMVENTGIQVDEVDDVCQNGKLAAVEIVNLLPKNNILSIKDKFLPCQGHLWHVWCKTNKELHRLTGNIENDKSQKEQEMTRIREKQCAASCSNLMKLFTKSLFTLPLKDKEYFLKWTQILTDDLSTDATYSIFQSYDRKWSEVLALKNRPNKPNNLEKEEKELERLSKQLQSATFGLEHIFREMGQIYEAHNAIYGETREGEWRRYPELAACLLISGHPLELMDGDAGHVPLKWISSVLDKVKMQLGDLKVFVLSVLGLQSSGKSTMLNAMFGLQFAVSAGRCTKGAFMQLIKISKEIRQDFNFDYFLVVDTEGLRALELESSTTPNHDNELATFVVGVGNLTLINIFGENPTEMQNVLQIVVQAFMRMKKIRVSPSCVFVHQNVTDVAAAERNMDGRRRLQEKLDQMVQLAAKEEDCDVSCFSEMIEFDIKKDVHYLAQLWEGSPPMAPPNPGYSESIRELRKHILSKASRSNGISLSHLKAHVQDLWEALLDENFVFSFKNTLEMAVYREMEVEYGNWTWHIRKDLLTIENQLYNRIENGDLNKLDLSSISTETIKTCEEIKEEMIKYFENEEKKDILAQWKGRFENKLKEFHDEQVREVQGKLQGVIQRKNTLKKMDSMKKGFEEKLLQKSKDISEKLKDKAKDETELKKEFDSVWENWVLDLTKGLKPIEDINLENDLFSILKNLGIEEKIIKECKDNGRYKVIPKIDDYSSYLNNFKMQKKQGNHSREL
ncbi:interferon-induced very large GTPase 1-like isoform X2 [Cyprinodon tularosa]|uniref:interferon-induced very large GTPase 1-like isoform X2 n=1 Tax=Cyprinodon tularosa TaxID=77115 RepID=UPI0018E278B7|nr:interferon-induced very large GTPase 1-like isoform X2 [Cyprinodon tularosa]